MPGRRRVNNRDFVDVLRSSPHGRSPLAACLGDQTTPPQIEKPNTFKMAKDRVCRPGDVEDRRIG
jgi:hypothetical protein